MSNFPSGTRTAFARAVAAELRALMAVERVSVRELALGIEDRSLNYLAIRLRDEKPFTLDDVEQICVFLNHDVESFVQRAYENHYERFQAEALEVDSHANVTKLDVPASDQSAAVSQTVRRAARTPRKKAE